MSVNTRKVVLFVDMLGVRSRWQRGGRPSVERAFGALHGLVTRALCDTPPTDILEGFIEADTVVLKCAGLGVAWRIGRRMFREAFLMSKCPNDERLWLRGVIVPGDGKVYLRQDVASGGAAKNVVQVAYSPSLMDAIALEKSGFKGMRLLLRGGSGTGRHSRYRQVTLNFDDQGKTFCPFRRIQGLGSSLELPQGVGDLLWMASETEEDWEELKGIMVRRLKWSASTPEEFLHAAATQTVFHQCGAFLKSIKEAPHLIGSVRNVLGKSSQRRTRKKALMQQAGRPSGDLSTAFGEGQEPPERDK